MSSDSDPCHDWDQVIGDSMNEPSTKVLQMFYFELLEIVRLRTSR